MRNRPDTLVRLARQAKTAAAAQRPSIARQIDQNPTAQNNASV